jgi:hypothetical protein
MLYPTSKPSSANVVRYRSKTPGKKEVLTQTFRACLRLHSLIVESKVVTPTFSWDYFRVDNKIRVSCVQWSGEQKSEGNPAIGTVIASTSRSPAATPGKLAVLYSCRWAPTESPTGSGQAGQAEERSIEAKKAAGPGLEE